MNRLAASSLILLGIVGPVAVSAYRVGAAPVGQVAPTFLPARLLTGPLPAAPSPNVVGRIEETLEVVVGATGRASQITPLRASPIAADPLVPAVANWQFQATIDQGRAVPSRVLGAAIFRPPQLDNSPTLGDPPVNLAAPSDEIPLPLVTETPPYPTLAIGDGVVLVEVMVGLDGRVRQPLIITGTSGFDRAALDAASRWTFRPARWNGNAVEVYAYLVFGFRQPVGTPLRPRSR